MKYLAVALAVSLSACATSHDPAITAQFTPSVLTDQEVQVVQKAVQRSLRDPQSAQFGELSASSDGSMVLICGLVNARNAYGGYTGFQPFNATMDEKTQITTINRMGGNQFEQRQTYEGCANYNVPSLWRQG